VDEERGLGDRRDRGLIEADRFAAGANVARYERSTSARSARGRRSSSTWAISIACTSMLTA
jgi:hypothetical protein